MLLMNNSLGRSKMLKKLLLSSILFLSICLPSYADRIVRVNSGSSSGGFILDQISAPVALSFSVRQLTASYIGKDINIRRASDSATTDIGFFAGKFDIAAFNTFCASTTCFIDTWYDQSGYGTNAVQATAANQPPISVDAGLNGNISIHIPEATASGVNIAAAANHTNMWASAIGGYNINVLNFVGTTTTNDRIWSHNATGGTASTAIRFNAGTNSVVFNQFTSLTVGSNTIPALSAGAHILEAGYSSALSTNVATFLVDAAVQTVVPIAYTGIPLDETSGTMFLGYVGGGQSCGCNLAEMIFWAQTIPTADQLNLLRTDEKVFFGTP